MAVSVHRPHYDLSDGMTTKVGVHFYSDVRNTVLNTVVELPAGVHTLEWLRA